MTDAVIIFRDQQFDDRVDAAVRLTHDAFDETIIQICQHMEKKTTPKYYQEIAREINGTVVPVAFILAVVDILDVFSIKVVSLKSFDHIVYEFRFNNDTMCWEVFNVKSGQKIYTFQPSM